MNSQERIVIPFKNGQGKVTIYELPKPDAFGSKFLVSVWEIGKNDALPTRHANLVNAVKCANMIAGFSPA